MKILFCDDDPQDLNTLQSLVDECLLALGVDEYESSSYLSGDELIKDEQTADLVFLDARMDGEDGISVGKHLMSKNRRTKIIMVTAFPDYLDDAMRFNVFRYISKPIDKQRLFDNIRDAIRIIYSENIEIPVETEAGVKVYHADDILCFESDSRKSIVHTTAGPLLSKSNIQKWRRYLEYENFYEPYKGFVINMKHVSSFTNRSIILKSGSYEMAAYLAVRKYIKFKNAFLIYKASQT